MKKVDLRLIRRLELVVPCISPPAAALACLRARRRLLLRLLTPHPWDASIRQDEQGSALLCLELQAEE
nr:unnamed protein product [Digitaria exilis]